MSEAEDKYLTCTHHKCSCEVDYIKELEQRIKEEEENHAHFKKCWLDELTLNNKLKSEKAELIEFVKKQKIMAEGYFDYKPKEQIERCDRLLKKYS